MLIGICDDVQIERGKIYNLCEEFFRGNDIIHEYKEFTCGEEVLEYCNNKKNTRIDLLYLDVEMKGMSGLELKDLILKKNMVWRIAFVTNHNDSIYGSFSIKTIGFITKPILKNDVIKMINIVHEEIKENILIMYKGYKGEKIYEKLENIIYFEADESYSRIYSIAEKESNISSHVISKKLGVIEKEMSKYGFIRVHRSYLVNVSNIIDVGNTVRLRNLEQEIPIGRKYKNKINNLYLAYGKEKIRKRL